MCVSVVSECTILWNARTGLTRQSQFKCQKAGLIDHFRTAHTSLRVRVLVCITSVRAKVFYISTFIFAILTTEKATATMRYARSVFTKWPNENIRRLSKEAFGKSRKHRKVAGGGKQCQRMLKIPRENGDCKFKKKVKYSGIFNYRKR